MLPLIGEKDYDEKIWKEVKDKQKIALEEENRKFNG